LLQTRQLLSHDFRERELLQTRKLLRHDFCDRELLQTRKLLSQLSITEIMSQ
jgi:hypothetical protein